MMPLSAPNYNDAVDWLTAPAYQSALLLAVRVVANAPMVTFTLEAGASGHSIVVIVRSGGA